MDPIQDEMNMATQTLPPPTAIRSSDRKGGMLTPTRSALETFADRRARLLSMRGVAIGFMVFVIGMLLLVVADRFIRAETVWRVAASLVVDTIAVLSAWWFGIRESRKRDWTAIAQRMESATPTLHERMLSAVELGDANVANGSAEFRGELQTHVAEQASRLEVARMLPWGLIRKWTIAAIGLASLVGFLSLVPSLQLPRRLARVIVPIAPIERASVTKIEIMRPTPPSGSVAEGDLVAVAVSVSRLGSDTVRLQRQSEDGLNETLFMSPRNFMPRELTSRPAERPKEVSDFRSSQIFAVNLQVHQTPVRYRVLAGDGETLWHTLTPQPRPRMVSFEKRYEFPDYARLPDRTRVDEFGDLIGIVGTEANVVVTFDQPVAQVELLFGNGQNDLRIPVQSVDDSGLRFEYRIPIKTPGSYRVDAISIDSGLNNPFSPRFSIDPMIDRAPTAEWASGTIKRRIVSPAAMIDLAGTIQDDLPMDQFAQQLVLDDGEVIERPLSIQAYSIESASNANATSADSDDTNGDRQTSQVRLRWDMMNHDASGPSAMLSPGSQLKTRLVAIDRSGNRGASEWIHVFIAGSDFDASRHDELRRFQAFSRRVSNWLEDFAALVGELQDTTKDAKKRSDEPLLINPDWALALTGLESSWAELSGMEAPPMQASQSEQIDSSDTPPDLTITHYVANSNDSVASERWIWLDRYATQAMANVAAALQIGEDIRSSQPPLSKRAHQQLVGEVASLVSRAEKPLKQVVNFSQWNLSVELAAGLMRDLQMIQNDATILADENATVPIDRLPGQADLMIERLRQVGELATSMQTDLPINTVKHQERLHRYLAELTARIEQENEKLQLDQNPDVEVNFREAMQRISEELRYHLTTSLLQGDTFNRIASAVRELNRNDWMLFQEIERLREVNRDWNRASEQSAKARQEQDTAEMANAKAEEGVRKRWLNEQMTAIIDQYQRAETIQRQRRDANVQEVSDWKLVGRVTEFITNGEFSPPESTSFDDVLESVRKAASVLEAGNQTVRLKGQLQDLADRERYGNDLADGAIRQGLRLEHYQVASETPLQLLRDTGVDPKAMESLQATRWDSDFQQARQWTTSRRYDSNPFIPATAPVQSMVDRYRNQMPAIEEAMAGARRELRQYLPTTGELARDAADEAENQQAKNERSVPPESGKQEDQEQDADAQADPPPPTNPNDEATLQTLQEKVDALAEDLADRANTADYQDQTQRELARDADAALATMKKQMKAVVAEAKTDAAADPKASPDSPTPLQELAETLQTTAEHFDAADAGQDISQTRQALRDASPLSELQAASQTANSTSQAANSTPEELLERLEQRLDDDQVMQSELAEISQQTAAAVEQAVRSAAKQEKSLQQELEKADSEFLEKKRALRDQLKSLTDQSRAVNDQWLSMAESVSGWNQDQPAREKLRQSREQLRAAVDQAEQVQNDQALLQDLQSANSQLRQSIDDVVRNVAEVEKKADEKSNDSVHDSEKSRQQKARQLESAQRQTQNRWLQSLSRQAKDWQQRRDQAGKRAQSAQNQQRSAEKQLEQAQQQLQKHPDEEWAQKGVQESRERVEEAVAAGDQAKQTREMAEQAEKEASKRLSDSRRSTVQDLEAKNPSAELLARVAKKSTDELSRIAKDLQSMQNQDELAKSLLPSPSTARRLTEQQSQANQTVRQAADDLQRAARHEERLGNDAAAEQLDQAASDLQATLDEAMTQAEQSLAQSGQSPSSPNEPDQPNVEPVSKPQRSQSAQRASGQLGQAAQRLETQANQISELKSLLAATSEKAANETAANQTAASQADADQDDRNGAAPADPSPMKEVSTGTLAEASRSEKLARTLDELDRGIHQPQAADQGSSQSQASNASDQSGSQSQPSDQTADQPSGKPLGKSPTAGEASPTLAASAEQAIRELAAQRQKQVQQIASAGQSADPSSAEGESAGQSDANSNSETGNPSEGQAGQPGTVSGESSQMPDGGLIDANAQRRVDGQWGNLREQKNSDVIQDRKTSLPMSYRPAIEAYFQAISAEAARSQAKGGKP